MKGPLAPTFLAHSLFPVTALLEEDPFASVPLSLLSMVTAVVGAVITSPLGPNVSPRAA